MPTLLRRMKFQAIFALAAVFLLALPSIADAQSTGTVRFKVAKAGFIIGVGGGTGTLTFKGRTHPLRVDGIGAGTVGVTRLVGTASNLRTATDIVGTYSAAGAGLAVAGGARAATRLRVGRRWTPRRHGAGIRS